MIALAPLSRTHDCACDEAEEGFAKALAAGHGGDAALWGRHPDPGLAPLLEETTARLQAALLRVQDGFARALTGAPIGTLAKAMTPDELAAARHYLEKTPPAQYSPADWMLLADVVVAEHFPPTAIEREAEAMALRATLVGHLKAVLPGHQLLKVEDLADVTRILPTRLARVPLQALSATERAVLEVAQARAAMNITRLTDVARDRMKRLVVEHLQAMVRGQPQGTPQALRQRLGDEFGDLNRDMRRIAVTELGECAAQGFIAAQPVGTRVRRVEVYEGACPFCASINGKVFTVVAADDPNKDGERHVWPGKDNLGRSASPRRREGGVLVDREAHELWWVPAGLVHPNCRGSWVVAVGEAAPDGGPPRAPETLPPGVSREYADWLEGLLHQARVGRGSS